jgi:hypothetical protein
MPGGKLEKMQTVFLLPGSSHLDSCSEPAEKAPANAAGHPRPCSLQPPCFGSWGNHVDIGRYNDSQCTAAPALLWLPHSPRRQVDGRWTIAFQWYEWKQMRELVAPHLLLFPPLTKCLGLDVEQQPPASMCNVAVSGASSSLDETRPAASFRQDDQNKGY